MTNTFPVCMSMCTNTNGRVHTWVQYKIIYWKCFIVGEPKWSSEVPINNNVWCISNVSVILQPNWQLSTHEFHHWNQMKCTAVWHWTYHTLNISYIEHIHEHIHWTYTLNIYMNIYIEHLRLPCVAYVHFTFVKLMLTKNCYLGREFPLRFGQKCIIIKLTGKSNNLSLTSEQKRFFKKWV